MLASEFVIQKLMEMFLHTLVVWEIVTAVAQAVIYGKEIAAQ